MVINHGPAVAEDVTLTVDHADESIAEQAQQWHDDGDLPIKRLGPGSHYGLPLHRPFAQEVDHRLAVTVWWRDPYQRRRRWLIGPRRTDQGEATFSLSMRGPGPVDPAELRRQLREYIRDAELGP